MDADEDVVACGGRGKGSGGEVVGGIEGVEDLGLHGRWKRHGEIFWGGGD